MYQIREAQKGEESTVREIVKIVLEDYGLTMDEKTDEDLHDIYAHYLKNGGWFGILEYNGQIIGSYGIYNVGDQVCELRKMYLLKEYQGKKLGQQLMDHALEKAGELGFKEMILETNHKLDKAIRLYEKYGFVTYNPEHLSPRCDLAMKLKLQ